MKSLTVVLLSLLATMSSQRTAYAQALTGASPKTGDTTEAKKAPLRLHLSLENDREGKIRAEFNTGEMNDRIAKTMDDLAPGAADVSLSGMADGEYYVFFSAPGYASRWDVVKVAQGKSDPAELKVKLFRKRYVVLRYAFNASGGRELSGKDVKEGRAAVSHWGSLPFFQQDWQIWQKPLRDDPFDSSLFGDTPFLDFHRYSDGFGFTEAPKGIAFDELKQAPPDGSYKCRSTKAEKGLTLFCRIEGDRKEGLGYGKIIVEDVTENPPAGIKRNEESQR